MKTNSFNNFQTLFYETVEDSKNLAPFYNKVNGYGVYQTKDKNMLVVTFDYTDITGIHRYGKVQFPFTDITCGDIDALAESAVMAFTYHLSMAYPGFVCWRLADAISAVLDYYAEQDEIPEAVEREWLGYANAPGKSDKQEDGTVFTVGMMSRETGKFLVVSNDAEDYIKFFNIDECDMDYMAMATEVIKEFFA